MTRTALALILAAAGCGGDRAPAEKTARNPAAPPAEAADCPPAPECPPPTPVAVPCPEPPPPPSADPLTLEPAGWDELPGWEDDDHYEAIPPFLKSCGVIAGMKNRERIGNDPHSGKVRQWRAACAAAKKLPKDDHAAARAFFEAEFRPYAALGSEGPKAKYTGYFVQPLDGSKKRHGDYQTPILERPADLVEVPLSDFVPDGRGRRIWGRVNADGELVPYPTSAEIRKAPFGPNKKALLWVDDPVDALFASIEGSGVVEMDDGSTVWIRFAGKNGLKFRGAGGVLRAMGELKRGEGTMQGIRKWFNENPDRFYEITDISPSKVFFEISPRPGAFGTQMVTLTPARSLAVDRGHIALSTPIWVSTRAPVPNGGVRPFRRLTIAQDTGGAIRGPVRGDIYWGADADAADVGGRTGGYGKMWILLPTSVRVGD